MRFPGSPLLLLLAACGKDPGGEDDTAGTEPAGTPDISLSTTEISFGQVPIGVYTSRAVIVTNEGDGDLEVDASLEGSSALEVSEDVDSEPILPGASAQLSITYTPIAAGGDSATLTLTSNDPDEPSLEVTVSGEGLEKN